MTGEITDAPESCVEKGGDTIIFWQFTWTSCYSIMQFPYVKLRLQLGD